MRAMSRRFHALLLFLPLIFAAHAPVAAKADGPRAVEARLRGHVDILASDAMEGRKPGTPGGEKAAAYIAAQFAEVGLLPGAAGGSYYAPVDLVEQRVTHAAAAWVVGGQAQAIAPQLIVLAGGEPISDIAAAPLIFGGFGKDLVEATVRGAVVMIYPGRPEGAGEFPSFSARRDALAKAGARAVLRIETAAEAWPVIREAVGDPRTTLAGTPRVLLWGALSNEAWTSLLTRLGRDPAALLAAANAPGFVAEPLDATLSLDVKTVERRYRSWNVIGRQAGSDPSAGAIFYLAHYDHLGLCRPEGMADRICNGAVDNASGVAMTIEIARALAADLPAPRDRYFIATTAEEMGLLGARALLAAPPVPAASIAAVLNFDTVAVSPRRAPVAMVGRGRTPLDPIVDAVARRLGRRINPSTEANALINRQDGWIFTEAGIPAAMIGGSLNMAYLNRFLEGTYHKPDDDLAQPLPLDGVAEDVHLHRALGRILADPAQYRPPPR